MATPIDAEVTALARRIAELGAGEESRVFHMSWWSERMLAWAMAHPEFKTQLFRFVDVFPATHDASDVLRHIHEYFQGADAPKLMALGVDLAEKVPFGDSVSASVARRNILRMAEQFIVGATPAEAVDGLHQLWRQGSAFTVDLLGEKTVTEAEADRYATRVDELLRALVERTGAWAPDDTLEFDDRGALPRVNVSVKPTALASLYSSLTRDEGIEQAKSRLRPLLHFARDHGAFVYFDMEHYDVKELTLQLFRELLDEPGLEDVDAGIVVQAYLKDARDDLAAIIDWSRSRTKPVGVRLVKGAYWDSETILARAEGWPVPVYESKDETDANYERLARMLHDHHDDVRAAFASHNLRSLAYAITYARTKGIPDSWTRARTIRRSRSTTAKASTKRLYAGARPIRRMFGSRKSATTPPWRATAWQTRHASPCASATCAPRSCARRGVTTSKPSAASDASAHAIRNSVSEAPLAARLPIPARARSSTLASTAVTPSTGVVPLRYRRRPGAGR